MTNEPSPEEAAARLDDARNPAEAAATVAKFTGPGGDGNYNQLQQAGVDDKTLAAVIRGKEAKAAKNQGNAR